MALVAATTAFVLLPSRASSCPPSSTSTSFPLRPQSYLSASSRLPVSIRTPTPVPLTSGTQPVRSRLVRSSSGGAPDEGGGNGTGKDEEGVDLGVKAALSMLRFYKREISPLLPSSCRYVPTCSEYSMEAYKKYGVVKGTVLTACRLCRCNPLGGSGFDPPRWFDESSPTDT